jgi:hypothetical protein
MTITITSGGVTSTLIAGATRAVQAISGPIDEQSLEDQLQTQIKMPLRAPAATPMPRGNLVTTFRFNGIWLDNSEDLAREWAFTWPSLCLRSGTLYITSGTVRVMNQAALPATDLQWFQSNSSAGLDLVAPGDYPMASINSFGSMLRVGTTGTGSVSLTVAGGSTLTGNADKKMQVNPRTTVVLNGAGSSVSEWANGKVPTDAELQAFNTTATGGISGFAADKFRVNTSGTNGTTGFSNPFGAGTFSVTTHCRPRRSRGRRPPSARVAILRSR